MPRSAAIVVMMLAAAVNACSNPPPPMSQSEYLEWCVEFAEDRIDVFATAQMWNQVAQDALVAQTIAEETVSRAPDTATGRDITEGIELALKYQLSVARVQRGEHISAAVRKNNTHAWFWIHLTERCASDPPASTEPPAPAGRPPPTESPSPAEPVMTVWGYGQWCKAHNDRMERAWETLKKTPSATWANAAAALKADRDGYRDAAPRVPHRLRALHQFRSDQAERTWRHASKLAQTYPDGLFDLSEYVDGHLRAVYPDGFELPLEQWRTILNALSDTVLSILVSGCL